MHMPSAFGEMCKHRSNKCMHVLAAFKWQPLCLCECSQGWDPIPVASITSVQLECLGLGNKRKKELGKFALWGIDKTRIKSALSYICPHGCNCSNKFDFKKLEAVVSLFWSLTKAGQDAILWSLTTTCAEHRRIWSLEGIRVCRSAFCKLLGIGRNRLTRVKGVQHGRDGRSLGLCSESLGKY